MAQIAGITLRQVYPSYDALDMVMGLPIGALVDDWPIVQYNYTGTLLGNRFPTPPSALSFLTQVEDPLGENLIDQKFASGVVLSGALAPAGTFLEPTRGQIWPIIG